MKKFKNLLYIQDSMAAKIRAEEVILYLNTKTNSLPICIDKLSDEEKSKLFYALKKFAPSVYINEDVQKALVGTKVLDDPRYTEIWFDILNHDLADSEQVLLPDQLLGNKKYKLIEEIRSGGEATTYLAEDQSGNDVVLKRFQLASSDSISTLVQSASSFENETALLSQLDHPLIVKMLDFFLDGKSTYLVLEKVDGVTLRDYIEENGTIKESEALNIAAQLCEVLEYLHGKSPPIVHRDFTPENILLCPDGKIKVIDFSVAEQRKKEAETNCAGKHAYTPPEQFRGNACPASDLYSLGGVVYYLLSGEDPKPLSQVKSIEDVDETTLSIIKSATALDLDDRYNSVEWMSTEIASALEKLNPEKDSAKEERTSDSSEPNVLKLKNANMKESENKISLKRHSRLRAD